MKPLSLTVFNGKNLCLGLVKECYIVAFSGKEKLLVY
jgi:hypothetical protein